MELSKINLKLCGKQVTIGLDAPVSIEGREKWLVKHLGMTPQEAHEIVHDLMALAIYDGAMAWWRKEIPDDEDPVTWINRRYDILLFDVLEGGDMS